MIKSEREKLEKMDKMIGKKYDIRVWKKPIFYGERICRGEDFISASKVIKNVTLINVNGWGIGQAHFQEEDETLLLLPWSAIITMEKSLEKDEDYLLKQVGKTFLALENNPFSIKATTSWQLRLVEGVNGRLSFTFNRIGFIPFEESNGICAVSMDFESAKRTFDI